MSKSWFHLECNLSQVACLFLLYLSHYDWWFFLLFYSDCLTKDKKSRIKLLQGFLFCSVVTFLLSDWDIPIYNSMPCPNLAPSEIDAMSPKKRVWNKSLMPGTTNKKEKNKKKNYIHTNNVQSTLAWISTCLFILSWFLVVKIFYIFCFIFTEGFPFRADKLII